MAGFPGSCHATVPCRFFLPCIHEVTVGLLLCTLTSPHWSTCRSKSTHSLFMWLASRTLWNLIKYSFSWTYLFLLFISLVEKLSFFPPELSLSHCLTSLWCPPVLSVSKRQSWGSEEFWIQTSCILHFCDIHLSHFLVCKVRPTILVFFVRHRL